MKIKCIGMFCILLLAIFIPIIIQRDHYLIESKNTQDPITQHRLLAKAAVFYPWNPSLITNAVLPIADRPLMVIEYLQPLYDLGSLDADAKLIFADNLLRMHRYDLAINIYRDIANQTPALPRFYKQLANAYHQNKNYKDEWKVLKMGLDKFPSDPELNFAFGLLFIAYERPGASSLLMAATNPENLQVLIELDKNDAITDPFDRSIKQGITLLGMSEWGLAELCFRRASQLKPNDASGWAWLSLVQAAQNDPNHRETIKIAMRNATFDPQYAQLLGQYFILAGDQSEAKKYFLQALTISPHNPYLYLQLGSLSQVNDIPESLGYFVQAVNETPNDPLAWEALLKFCLQTNSYLTEEGELALNKLQSIKPNDPHTLYYAGRFQMASGDYSLAQKTFSEALKINPDFYFSEEIMFYRAYALIQSGDKLGGRSVLETLIDKFPDGKFYQQTLGLMAGSFR